MSYWGLPFTSANAADVRSPGAGNPLDSLPKVEPAQPQTMDVDIQTKGQDPALQRLLASRIVPSRFQIAGVKTLPFDAVAAQFSGLANREVTVAELLQAANNVTQMYKDKGYPLSFAFIPAQTFDNNIVVVNVVEGYVSEVNIEGNPGASEGRLREIAEQLKNDRPLSSATFERITGILSLQPGMLINATVKPPPATDGAAEMVLNVKRKAVTVGAGLDNATSSLRGIISATENGLTPLGEQITVSTLVPRGPLNEKYYGLTYAQPLGKQGLQFQLNLSDYSGEPENQSLVPQQFNATYLNKTRRLGASLSYPLILNNRTNLTLTGGAYAAENTVRYTRSVPALVPVIEVRSSIRALSLEMAWTKLLEKGSTQLSLGLYQGMNTAGASLTNSNVDLNFTRLKTLFTQTYQLPAGFGAALSGSGQLSGSVLPLSEQISFGSKLFGLAYPAGEIAGDQGWGLSLELNRAIPFDATYLKQIQPYVMTDSSRAYVNSGDLPHNKIASIGAGMRFSDQRHYSLDLSIAQPVGQKPINSDDRPLRLNMSYTYQFD
jgi:hemolysin activation/secretion protein